MTDKLKTQVTTMPSVYLLVSCTVEMSSLGVIQLFTHSKYETFMKWIGRLLDIC